VRTGRQARAGHLRGGRTELEDLRRQQRVHARCSYSSYLIHGPAEGVRPGWVGAASRAAPWRPRVRVGTPGLPRPSSESGQGSQQRRGVHEVRRREAFRERAVDGRERGAGLVARVLALPEAGEAHRGPQLPCLALLATCRLDGGKETGLGGGLVIRFSQVQLTLETVQLGLLEAIVVLLREGQTLVQRLAGIVEAAGLRVRVAQHAVVTRQKHSGAGGAIGVEALLEHW